MNLNPLILANIQSSSYFKVSLFKLKTYHEVVDEIYYQVKHLEPWERGSRKTAGQTGMCGGVRGVGAGGIVSTAYCLLYKLYTLRLTRKQVNGLLTHTDSPYIRSLGFMYLRYTQPPGDLYDWYEDYLQDEEEVDAKAGGGQTMTIGQMIHQWLVKLDWFSTLFPRIPVPIQKQIEKRLDEYSRKNNVNLQARYMNVERETGGGAGSSGHMGKRDGREQFDRSRVAPNRNEYRDDRRFRSRSKERTTGDSRDRRGDGHRDHRNDYHRNRDRSRERGGRDKDYYRDGEGSSDQYSSSSRHRDRDRDRDRKYR
ncbi:hypothetical protein HA402_012879 [Bradysia odoriphaga]|nr:hypothetical protein HA402_012879 [Bradysia odoriphaga]